jgi:hypothetical protein
LDGFGEKSKYNRLLSTNCKTKRKKKPNPLPKKHGIK